MNETDALERFATARVAFLASASSTGQPHIVPITFALAGSHVYTMVDAKPKRSPHLRRHATIAANPKVSVLAQHWDEDFSQLWWVRADGLATLTDDGPAVADALRLLRAKYQQYDQLALATPVIDITVHTWRWWSAAP